MKKKGWWPWSTKVKNDCALQATEREMPATKDAVNLLEKFKMIDGKFRKLEWENQNITEEFRKLEWENQNMTEEMRKIKANMKDDK